MSNLLGITVRPELVYDPKGNEWRERALTAEKQLDAVRAELGGIERRKSSPLSTADQVNFNRGWNRLHSIVQAALQGEKE